MTLTQLRYLVAIADADLNITLAAARVHAPAGDAAPQADTIELSAQTVVLLTAE